MTKTEMLFLFACIFSTVALVFAESRQLKSGKAIFKCLASTAFVAFALECSALSTRYGQLIVAALVLSWIGDMLLLSQKSKFFLSGIAAFLFAHVVFAISFASRPLDFFGLVIALIAMSIFGWLTLRWLWPYLSGFYKFAVSTYITAIALMCSLAISASIGSNYGLYALGALIFAASDISVARDRFVKRGFINRAWGLPFYYSAQLILAWTVTH
ncbi:MAG: lysoplasmalogenase [Arenimonas sp.]